MKFKINLSVWFFKPSITASQRTKNKIALHGKEGFHVIEKRVVNIPKKGNAESYLLESITRSANKEWWLGWLPIDEIIVENE